MTISVGSSVCSTVSSRSIVLSSSAPVLLESNLDHFALVLALEEILRLDQLHECLAWVVSRATTSMNGFTCRASFSRAYVSSCTLSFLVDANAVLQLHSFQSPPSTCQFAALKFFAGDDGRLLHKAILHRLGQRIVEDDVLERHGPCAPFRLNGVAVSSRPRIGFSSLMACMPADAR